VYRFWLIGRHSDYAGIVRWLVNATARITFAWHAGAALADIGALAAAAVRRPIRMVLPDPSGVVATEQAMS
jgi:hypothetical protein